MARSVVIPASMRRALAELKAGPGKGREMHLGAVLMPRPVSLDEWEEIARPQQLALMQASADDHERAQAGDPPLPKGLNADERELRGYDRPANIAKEQPTWTR